MTGARWARIRELFEAAGERPIESRESFLAGECEGDAELARQVATLLRASEDPSTFLSSPPPSVLPPLPTPGCQIGAYTVTREIGRGGMGAVYLAERSDRAYEKRVAIKLMRLGMGSERLVRQFLSERQMLASLEHPNIARLLDGGATPEGMPYLVMEYIEGVPVDRYCEDNGLPLRARLRLFLQVCAAVEYAHRNLIVHGDIKPGNLLVAADRTVKLVDFGVARLVQSRPGEEGSGSLRLFTPEYASPEQLRGEPVNVASDVYSMGLVLYRLLTGLSAFPAGDPAARDRAPELPSRTVSSGLRRELHGDLDQIVLKTLQAGPAARYGSASQLAADVRNYLDGYPVAAHNGGLWYHLTKLVLRHRLAAVAVGLGLSGILAGSAEALWFAHDAMVERARAERRFQDVRALANHLVFDVHDSVSKLAGSTSARSLIVKRALEYLDSLSREEGGDPALQRDLAAAYQRIGEIQGSPLAANLGDREGALRSQLAALAIRRKLAAGQPEDRQAQLDLSISNDRVGDLRWAAGARAEALDEYRDALEIRKRLWAADPVSAVYAHYLTTSYNNVGDLLQEESKYSEARVFYEDARRIAEDAAARHAGDVRALRDLTVSWNRIGDCQWYASDFPAALQSYRSSLAMRERLCRLQPDNAVFRRDLIAGHNNIGDALLQLRSAAAAIGEFETALEVARRLSAADPVNAQAQRDLAISYKQLGAAQQRAGRKAAAVESLRKAMELVDRLRKNDPGNAVLARDAAEVNSLMPRR